MPPQEDHTNRAQKRCDCRQSLPPNNRRQGQNNRTDRQHGIEVFLLHKVASLLVGTRHQLDSEICLSEKYLEDDQCDDKADDNPQNYLLLTSENHLPVHRFMIARVINRC